jgi:hypothetical protein
MAMDAPAATTAPDVPVLESRGGAPVDVRYSDFMKLVNADQVEKVTFSADGTKLLGVDNNGVRLKIESLPNDPDLLNQLTGHKVRFTGALSKLNLYTTILFL